jgi:hypothetical protein
MSKQDKKKIRAAFRNAVFSRDRFTCKGCGEKGTEETLDAHHITSRDLMESGGYVAENGITLCKKVGGCHEKAEAFDANSNIVPGFEPTTLYSLIGSTYAQAIQASEKLKKEERNA